MKRGSGSPGPVTNRGQIRWLPCATLVQHAIGSFPIAQIELCDHPGMGLQRIATQKFREPQDTPKVRMAPMSL